MNKSEITELKVWASMDVDDTEYDDVATSAMAMFALKTEAEKSGLEVIYHSALGTRQISVEAPERVIIQLLINCMTYHGEYGYTVDAPSYVVANRLDEKQDRRSGHHLIGMIDVEDTLCCAEKDLDPEPVGDWPSRTVGSPAPKQQA